MSHTAAYDADPARWSRAWQHRERLLRIARRRTMSEQEAEDAVSEVLLRASEGAITDDDAFARWLTSVTLNVCADIAREHSMSGKHAVYSVRQLMPVPSPEQVVVDRETAATAVHRLSRLPDRQREALLLRSAGFGVDEIAEHLDVSYKTAESLLSRARAFMRKTVAVLLAIFVGLGRLLRRPAKTAPAFAVAALTIAVGIVPNAGADRPHWVQLGSGPALTVKVVDRPQRAASASLRPASTKARPNVHSTRRGARSAPHRTLVQPAKLGNKQVGAQTPGVNYAHGAETLLQTTRRCLANPRLSTTVIGCPP